MVHECVNYFLKAVFYLDNFDAHLCCQGGESSADLVGVPDTVPGHPEPSDQVVSPEERAQLCYPVRTDNLAVYGVHR